MTIMWKYFLKFKGIRCTMMYAFKSYKHVYNGDTKKFIGIKRARQLQVLAVSPLIPDLVRLVGSFLIHS